MSSDDRPRAPLTAAFVVFVIAPFVVTAFGIWTGMFGIRPEHYGLYLILHTTVVILATGALRAFFASRREGAIDLSRVTVSAAPPVVALGAAALSGVMDRHWTFALLLGALAVQGAWDITAYGVPPTVMRMRPMVFITALLSLLVALVGS